jgi:hypothetical protein
MSEPILEAASGPSRARRLDESRRARRRGVLVRFALVSLLLLPYAGCGSGDSPEADEAGKAVEAENAPPRPNSDEADNAVEIEKAVDVEKAVEAEEPVAGSFVGEVSGTRAFVAVIAAPAQGNVDSRGVQVFVSDGRRLSEWFSGSILDNSFIAESEDGDTEAKGTLSGDSVTGTVELPGGKTVKYEASPPSGPAGLYELTVSSGGALSGASTAGLGVTGEITLERPGTGILRLVDGGRITFDVTPAGELIPTRTGQVHLIVLPGGQLRGAGTAGQTAGDDRSDFFIRSA